MLRTDDAKDLDEKITFRRILFWSIIWISILVGIVSYFRYARALTPLLG